MQNNLLDIVAIDDSLEALAIRAAVEWWGMVTRTYFIGKSEDLVELFNGKETRAPHLLLMCHGTEKGIVLPELGTEIAKNQPYNYCLTPANLAEFLSLQGQTVISTGCKTGTKAFADAFLNAGAHSFIAPSDFPEGDASLFFLLNFYYFSFSKSLSVKEAHDRSRRADKNTGMFTLFEH